MGSVRLWAPLAQGVLYNPFYRLIQHVPDQKKTLYLNRFRGKPAISKFDWPFTPSQKSSPPFATDVGSVLQRPFSLSSTCFWLDHLVSGPKKQTLKNIFGCLVQAKTKNQRLLSDSLSLCLHLFRL